LAILRRFTAWFIGDDYKHRDTNLNQPVFHWPWDKCIFHGSTWEFDTINLGIVMAISPIFPQGSAWLGCFGR